MSMQNERLWRLEGERELQMRQLTSQLLLLEANLRRTQRGLDAVVRRRERLIARQQRTIHELQARLENVKTKTGPHLICTARPCFH